MKKTVLCLLLGFCFMALGVQGQPREIFNLNTNLCMTDIQPNGEVVFAGFNEHTNRALDDYPTIGIINANGTLGTRLSFNYLSYRNISVTKCSTGRYVMLASNRSRDTRMIDTLHIYTFTQSQLPLTLQKTITGRYRGIAPTYSPLSPDSAIISFQDSAILVNPNTFNRITSFGSPYPNTTTLNSNTVHQKLFQNVILTLSESNLLSRIFPTNLDNRTVLPLLVIGLARNDFSSYNPRSGLMKRVRDSIFAWGTQKSVIRGHVRAPLSNWLVSQYPGLDGCHSAIADGDTSFMVSTAYTGPGVSPTNTASVVLVSFNHFRTFQVWMHLPTNPYSILYYFDRKYGKSVFGSGTGRIFVSSQIATSLPSAVNTIRPVQVFPNPATNSLSFPQEAISFGPQTRVTAVDMLGKTTILQPDPSTQQLDISTLNQGTYLLSWEVNGLFYRSKFVKE